MALISCAECGQNVSDQASSCPGCGYPLGDVLKSTQKEISQLDHLCYTTPAGDNVKISRLQELINLTKEEIWFKAYSLHYTGYESNIPDIVNMYRYIVANYEYTEEGESAKKQLNNLLSRYDQRSLANRNGSDSKKEISTKMADLHEFERYRLSVGDRFNTKLLNNDGQSSCESHTALQTKTSNGSGPAIARCVCGNEYPSELGFCPRCFTKDKDLPKQNLKDINSIPTYGGLAALAFIIGLGVLGGIVLGSHFRTKKMIASGRYDEALKASSNTLIGALIVILGVPAVAAFIIFTNPH